MKPVNGKTGPIFHRQWLQGGGMAFPAELDAHGIYDLDPESENEAQRRGQRRNAFHVYDGRPVDPGIGPAGVAA
jgi:hypothetical protein